MVSPDRRITLTQGIAQMLIQVYANGQERSAMVDDPLVSEDEFGRVMLDDARAFIRGLGNNGYEIVPMYDDDEVYDDDEDEGYSDHIAVPPCRKCGRYH